MKRIACLKLKCSNTYSFIDLASLQKAYPFRLGGILFQKGQRLCFLQEMLKIIGLLRNFIHGFLNCKCTVFCATYFHFMFL